MRIQIYIIIYKGKKKKSTYVEGNTNSSGVIRWQLNVGAEESMLVKT